VSGRDRRTVWFYIAVVLFVFAVVYLTDPAHGQTPTPDITSCETQLALCSIAMGRQHAAEETHLAYDDETATVQAGRDYRSTAEHGQLIRIITKQAADIRDLAAARTWTPTETPAPVWRVILPAVIRGR